MSESTGDLLFGTARRLRREFGAALLEADVTPSQARALRHVMESGSMRPSVLAERLHIAARSATEVVDALEARGLVERGPDPELAEVDRVRREQSERFLAVLSEPDRRSLDRILRILVDQ